ncbi:transmembrane amino acid transporter protein-domain-containing protein [Pilobolus umbonatus]|nr:transmembrane amino acid transporter protein-domain-containing protein [Pilobolus umbonatus]
MISQQLPADKSSFLQSVFNAVNVLVGVGILALPLAFRIAGWVYGSLIFLFCSLGTRYSAKIIIKCIQNRPNAVYSDMGETAFGNQGRNVISTIFVIELITIGVAMIVLLGDGLQSLFPHLTLEWTRLISALILSPTLFLSVRKLAYTSLIGIIGCICLVIIVLCDGFSKTTHPGSLIDHMPTEWYPSDIRNLPLAFGLIMSGFAGHAIFPSIYRDMENPKKYNRVVDLTYGITITCYIIMGVSGYLMFGQDTMQENLAMMVEYNKALNDFAIWLLVLTPIAKFGLMMHPLNKSWELCLFGQPSVETWMKSHNESYWKQRTLTILGKLLVTCSLVYVAYLFPGFDKVMSLLGALFSFTISLIFPLICHIQLFKHTLTKKELVFNWFLLILSMGMAMFGTVWSFKPSEV